MSKLNLVIADSDEEYLNGVVTFLSEKYLTRFKILSFSQKESLMNFISTHTEKLDILLISSELYFEEISDLDIALVGILSTGRLSREYNGCEIVLKYQLGENLVKNILNLYSDKTNEIIITKGQNETKVVAVYSSSGGSGKTTISYGCSVKSVHHGRKAFYLNLEESASTPLLFGMSSQYNLSHVLYYLKSKNKSLSLKIEGIKVIDQETGVHYFNPPVNHLELLEIEPSEYFDLISHMKDMNQYEAIFVDMPCFIEKRMMAVLDASDTIFYVLNPNQLSKFKLYNFLSELDILDKAYKQKLLSKTVFILNRAFNGEEGYDIFRDILDSIGMNISYVLPESSNLYTYQNNRIVLDLSGKFGRALEEVVERVI